MSHVNSESARNTDVNLVEQILEQGQRLRNAMVQAILNNDPFNRDITSNKPLKCSFADAKPKETNEITSENCLTKRSLPMEEKHKFLAYLRGEQMSKQDERQVLETFREMSNSEIYDATERSASSDYSCNCDTCKTYYKHNLSCDFNHSSSKLCIEKSNVPPLDLYRYQKELCKVKGNGARSFSLFEYLKYVDSLKISVHNLLLNQEGNKKVCGSVLDKRIKLPTSISHTYFIEYNVPDVLTKQNVKTKSKVDSGLDCPNLVRMCSKKLQNEAVYFKQISLHEVHDLHQLDLSTINIKFCVTCRTLKQKNSNLLGYATFNMSSFLETKYLSSNQELLLMLNNEAPIILGTLKVSLQLGCEQLYFGKEFIDAIQANKENICKAPEMVEEDVVTNALTNPHHNSQASLLSHYRDKEFVDTNYEIINKKVVNDVKKPNTHIDCDKRPLPSQVVDSKVSPKQSKLKVQNVNVQDDVEYKRKHHSGNIVERLDYNKEVLFGFVYLSEAQYYCDIENSFVTCQPFCQDDVLYSRLIYCSASPVYNFHQVTPFVYDDEFLNKLRDNYMIIEFWEKFESRETIIGLCKIPLHQFFIAFRNPVIVKYLARNKLPVIGCDGWEAICDPVNGQVYGEVQILVALGTEEQINNLEIERGFKNEIVTAKSTHTLLNKEITRRAANTSRLKNIERHSKDTGVFYNKQVSAENKKLSDKSITGKIRVKTPTVNNLKTVDIGVQSNLQMGEESKGNDQQRPLGQDLLGSFLAQLIEQKHKNISVENSTNTDNTPIDRADVNDTNQTFNHNKCNPNVRKTSDLLDSLQKAFLTEPPNKVPESSDTFKARIVIANALHLPSRKKYKCKKSRGKNSKPEEVLPSTYVTFEPLPGADVKSTQVVQKSKNPEWDYECDVSLPAELLTDTQKRLIFKVWKKSNSTSLQPNVHTDAILGFAGLDLTVLLAGLPIVSGWFNIIDVSSKCNGQIKINVTPLENLSKFNEHTLNGSATSIQTHQFEVDTIIPEEEKIEVGKAEHQGEFLSRALKRKFTELDEITQRLRLRLSCVTNDESESSNDDFVEEFERDINTLCVEDDYETVNFEDSSKSNTQDASTALLQIQNCNFIYKDPVTSELSLLVDNVDVIGLCNLESNENMLSLSNKVSNPSSKLTSAECSSSSVLSVAKDLSVPSTTDLGQLDKQLLAGKQRIDTLLQKLSLFTQNDADTFSSRYISGCSSKQNDEVQLSGNVTNHLKIDGDVDHDFIVNPMLFHNLRSDSIDTTPLLLSQHADARLVSSTSSSLITEFSECRATPDGAGNISHDKNMNTSSTTT